MSTIRRLAAQAIAAFAEWDGDGSELAQRKIAMDLWFMLAWTLIFAAAFIYALAWDAEILGPYGTRYLVMQVALYMAVFLCP